LDGKKDLAAGIREVFDNSVYLRPIATVSSSVRGRDARDEPAA